MNGLRLYALSFMLQFAFSHARNLTSYISLTPPLPLHVGEITNSFHHLKIPKGPIAVYRFQADVVQVQIVNGQETIIPTPIYDAYLHHYAVGSNHIAYPKRHAPMMPKQFSRSIGFGAGTESRGTPLELDFPYAVLTVPGEDEWVTNVHIINTRSMTPLHAHTCLECPCTLEDKRLNNSVNGMDIDPYSCNVQLREEKNDACFAETYKGGLRCCEDKEYCMERSDLLSTYSSSQVNSYRLRYSILYEYIKPENRAVNVAQCCDATGDLDHRGNIEYDLPECNQVDHPDCVHTLSTKQRLDMELAGREGDDQANGDRDVEIVSMVGHQHRAGLGISVYDDQTNELLCTSVPEYGNGDHAGNEKGYIIAMSRCKFDPPLKRRASDILHIVSLYNNTIAHTGVMSLVLIAISDIPMPESALYALPKSTPMTNIMQISTEITGLIAVGAAMKTLYKKFKERRGYRRLRTLF